MPLLTAYILLASMPPAAMPPLEQWTFQTVLDLVRTHEFEPGHFDYKSVLTGSGPQRDEVLTSIQRTACSLANTDGGYILFGVKDRRDQVPTPEERVVGIPLGGDLRKQFGDKLQQIQPECTSRPCRNHSRCRLIRAVGCLWCGCRSVPSGRIVRPMASSTGGVTAAARSPCPTTRCATRCCSPRSACAKPGCCV